MKLVVRKLPPSSLVLSAYKIQGQSTLAKGDITWLLLILFFCHVMAAIFGLIEPEIVPFGPPTP